MIAGIENDILSFNIESEQELDQLGMVAAEMKKIAPVAIRFNPNVDAGVHEFTKTGRKSDKFGVSIEAAKDLVKKCSESNSLKLVGLTCHLLYIFFFVVFFGFFLGASFVLLSIVDLFFMSS